MDQNLILIADNDRDVRDMLSAIVEQAGYRAVSAKDGNTAARILTVAEPIGLITDVRIPALNGFELCRLARLNPATRDMAILLISPLDHDVDAGLSAGADGVLPKPLSPSELMTKLQSLINSRRTTPEPTMRRRAEIDSRMLRAAV